MNSGTERMLIDGKNPTKILVVDDDSYMRDMLFESLTAGGYEVVTAASAEEALDALQHHDVHLMLSDITMPGKSGLELLHQVKSKSDDIDVILITGQVDLTTALESIRRGASDYITKPINLQHVSISVDRVLSRRRLIQENRAYQTQLEVLVEQRSAQLLERAREIEHLYTDLQATYEQTLFALGAALDLRDNETQGHAIRVVSYALILARKLDLPEAEMQSLHYGALLHDIGKIGIPDRILRKEAPLNSDEWKIMHCHPDLGYHMLKQISFLESSLIIVRHHHERWDGKGYPSALKGELIPLGARIFAIVDAFDAMTSNRPYRKAMPIASAMLELKNSAGTQFDPALVEMFLNSDTAALDAIRLEKRETHQFFR